MANNYLLEHLCEMLISRLTYTVVKVLLNPLLSPASLELLSIYLGFYLGNRTKESNEAGFNPPFPKSPPEPSCSFRNPWRLADSNR